MSSPRPCSFFLRNACAYGDSCRNSHLILDSVPSGPQALNNADSPACAFFLRGRCRFGDQCREFHPPSNPSESVEEYPKKPFCVYFNRGSCMKGTKCTFSHDRRDEARALNPKSPAEIEWAPPSKNQDTLPILSSSQGSSKTMDVQSTRNHDETQYPTTDRVIYNCNIQFGPGAAVLQVTTPFESRRVLISNIPTSATDGVISAAVSDLTTSAELQIHRSPLSPLITATLVFEDPNSAARATSLIDNISIGTNKLSGRLDMRSYTAAEEGKGVLRGRKVKLTWYGGRASAFVNYFTARSAEEQSQRLNGKLYRGYALAASFRPLAPNPTGTVRFGARVRRQSWKPTQTYTVMLRNLPLDTSKLHLTTFCQAESVALDVPECLDSPTRIHRALEQFGPVDMFDTAPMTKATSKIVAFAQFQTADAAAAAESGLRAAPPAFLGGGPFFIERTFSVKYSLRRILFTKLQGTLDLLAELHPSMIRYYLGENPKEAVSLILHGSEPKALGRIKTELDRIVQGEPLVVDGQKLWDEFFERDEGQIFLDSLNTSENVFVRCDGRTRTIRLFGPEQERVQARNLTLEKLVDVWGRRHVFPLRKDLIRVLLRGGLREMQEGFSSGTLAIDVVARTLTVNGDDGTVRRVHAALSALDPGKKTDVASDADSMCPVCFCTVEDPVRLDCDHLYCRDCLQHYLRPSSQDPSFCARKSVAEVHIVQGKGKNSTAPCGIDVSYSVIRSLLTAAEEDALLLASFLAYINEHPLDYRYCASPDCEMVYRPGSAGSSIQCPSCLIHICPACNVEYHEGITCAEHQDNLSGGLEALARWREKNGVKQCPNCHADIEKAGGCNHMTCALCKTHICWICMKTFSDEDSAGGVYSHLAKVHGGFAT
ncbi:hypothetical protein DFH07DRAFT_846388 [Mycena maculata]|uniref:RBR-type E3 ubiquitin transferase n=1 Tax=Mycena maculata TaxID=230809 RepID=A0AAD7I150_9AGAR|nr:hypothetical protein DFH07DRAFT_846388 [Mycena maculata]